MITICNPNKAEKKLKEISLWIKHRHAFDILDLNKNIYKADNERDLDPRSFELIQVAINLRQSLEAEKYEKQFSIN